jgi:PncC family amidohydrolase
MARKAKTSVERGLLDTLRNARASFVSVESCTGGLIADRLTRVPGSSDVVWGALVTYQERAKSSVLGISPRLLARHGAVSRAIAAAMAEAGFKSAGGKSRKVISVSTTGVAGPGGGSAKAPVGLCYIGIASSRSRGRARVIRVAAGRATRSALKKKFADRALAEALKEASRL